MATKNKPNEIYITRIYDAPVKVVWEAWVDPKQVAQWWGPRGFTLTSKNKDVTPGGKWTYTMHGPDGVDYPNITVFHEVEKCSRLVYDHGANENQPALFRVTVEFSEIKGKTKMEMTMAMANAEVAKETKKFIKSASGDSTWDRLAEYLSQEIEGKDIFVTHRTFEAPLNTVWETWTNPKHVAQWLAPTGSTMEYIKADIKPEGTSFYLMSNKDYKMYGKIHYKEITKPSKLVYTQFFCDENENITRHPMAPTWPQAMLTTILFDAEGDDQTRVSIRWEIDGNATTAERETFHKAKAGMTQGWTGSFDKLEDYLKTV
jgi:uncharacterized protein YndB with AHSA1/START domain